MATRISIPTRHNWQAKVAEHGFNWHTDENGVVYWDESAYWVFMEHEIEKIEDATSRCYEMVMGATESVIADRAALESFGYDNDAIRLIRYSHERERGNSLYTRFDFGYESGNPTLLEVNGDTPTSLLEGAATQWLWMEELFPQSDQFNSIHDRLVDYFRKRQLGEAHVMCISPHREDEGTVSYVEEVMIQGGTRTHFVPLDGIGLRDDGFFVDTNDKVIQNMFKLVPWEWLLESDYGAALIDAVTTGKINVMEPAWKMVSANKFLLETLHEKYPSDVSILRASKEPMNTAHVSKPVFGREGQNVTIRDGFGAVVEKKDGYYADTAMIHQERTKLLTANGRHAVIGSWIIDGEPAGMGLRESSSLITDNMSQFVPHIIR